MPAHSNSRRLIPLATVLCLMVAAAVGGYAVAGNRASQAVNLADAKGSPPGQTMTVYACLASGKLTLVSAVAAPKCPASSVPVHWSVQSGPAASANPQPSSAPSATSAPATVPTTPPAQTPSQPPTGGAAFVASCPAHGSTSDPGCGTWDAGPAFGPGSGLRRGTAVVPEPARGQPGPVDRRTGAAGTQRVLLPELVGNRDRHRPV